MSSELGKYGSTSVVQTSNVGFTSEVSHYLVVHTGPGRNTSGVDHVQHVVCRVVRRVSSAVKAYRV